MRRKVIAGIVATTAIVTAIGLSQPVKNPQLYPNPQYTTGVVATTNFQELTTITSCGTYSVCHRLTTDTMKTKVCGEYPDNCKVTHEIDHKIPICGGGADVIENLWAQPEHVVINGEDLGFHTKDLVESEMCREIKSGEITPQEAQQKINNDWVSYYHELVKNGKIKINLLGSVNSQPDEYDK